jgi:putative transposase
VPAEPLKVTGREIGLDLGITNLVATSEGDLFVAEHFGSRSRHDLAEAQRALSRCQEGSNRRHKRRLRVLQIHQKISNQRLNAAHKLSRQIVNDFDFIAVEDLEIAKMVKETYFRECVVGRSTARDFRAVPAGQMNKSIYDAGWGTLLSLISYKAESAGRVFVTVDPRYTSKKCSQCGLIKASNRVNQALFKCVGCRHEDHADINAACNILRAGRAQQAIACAGRDKAATLYPRDGSTEAARPL